MKFSIFATSIICGTVVLAAPAPNPQAVIMEAVVQPAAVAYKKVETFKSVIGAIVASPTHNSGSSNFGSFNPSSSSPTASATGSETPSSVTTFFRLVAKAKGDDFLNINGFYVGTYHVSAGNSLAHLTSPSEGTNRNGGAGNGRVFHTNSTDDELNKQLGMVATSSGPQPFPESIILADGLASTNIAYSRLGNIYINAGEGTKGVQVVQNTEGTYVLAGAGNSGYFACYNEKVPYGSTVTLMYLEDHEDIPEECESIVLIPECHEDDGGASTTGKANAMQRSQVGCYFGVSADLLAL